MLHRQQTHHMRQEQPLMQCQQPIYTYLRSGQYLYLISTQLLLFRAYVAKVQNPSESSANKLRWVIALPPAEFLTYRPIHQPHATCEQFLHHGLLDGAGLGAALFEGGDFGVDVAEDGGDGGLFFFVYRHEYLVS